VSLPVLPGWSCQDLLGICYVWHSCNVAKQGETLCLDNSRKVWLPGCLSHLIVPYVVHKHHWSTASTKNTSLLVTAQHSQPYSQMDRMQILCSFSFVEMEMLDFQIWLSRFCIASQVMALQREISGELELLSGQGSQDAHYNLLPYNCDCWWLILPADEKLRLLSSASSQSSSRASFCNHLCVR